MKLNKQQITKLIKHQEPFVFVDEAEIINDNEIIGTFTLKENNSILTGHFPNFPILPGVIAIEMMAQTALILSAYRENLTSDQYDTYFVKIENISFKSFIAPPANLTIKIMSEPYLMPNYHKISGSIFDDKKRKCYGEIISYFKKKEI